MMTSSLSRNTISSLSSMIRLGGSTSSSSFTGRGSSLLLLRTPQRLPSLRFFRYFSTSQLLKVVEAELEHEKKSYQPSTTETDTFLTKSGWSFFETTGNVNMKLTKTNVDRYDVTVEFQLVSPFNGDMNEEGEGENPSKQQQQQQGESEEAQTDFTVSVTRKGMPDVGAIFYCTTLSNDTNFRYMIGNISTFNSGKDKNTTTTGGVGAYNGPDFEDLDEKMQEALDEWLEGLGIVNDLCDFIDAKARDKEQLEYVNWLNSWSAMLK